MPSPFSLFCVFPRERGSTPLALSFFQRKIDTLIYPHHLRSISRNFPRPSPLSTRLFFNLLSRFHPLDKFLVWLDGGPWPLKEDLPPSPSPRDTVSRLQEMSNFSSLFPFTTIYPYPNVHFSPLFRFLRNPFTHIHHLLSFISEKHFCPPSSPTTTL